MRKTLTLFLAIVVILFAVDQSLKSFAPQLPLIRGDSGVIQQGYTEIPASRSPILPTAVWLLIFGRMLVRAKRARTAETIAFSLVLAGGGSTLYDRWRFGAIRAPFTIFVKGNQILPFGICDLAISIGGMWLCVLLAQDMITRPRQKR